MTLLRETCHCGHGRAMHYADPSTGERHTCLASGCECRRYVYEGDPKPPKAPKRPNHRLDCLCAGCKDYAASQKQLDTLPPRAGLVADDPVDTADVAVDDEWPLFV